MFSFLPSTFHSVHRPYCFTCLYKPDTRSRSALWWSLSNIKNHTMRFPSRDAWLIGNLLWRLWLPISRLCAISDSWPEERGLCYWEVHRGQRGSGKYLSCDHQTEQRQINNMVLNNCMSRVCVEWRKKVEMLSFVIYAPTTEWAKSHWLNLNDTVQFQWG